MSGREISAEPSSPDLIAKDFRSEALVAESPSPEPPNVSGEDMPGSDNSLPAFYPPAISEDYENFFDKTRKWRKPP